ncbi:hypothetical protein D6851_15270 [Altericroceibacterium spongiae]|uniref:DUF4129 domain-containing protein n=1 Tax=Altericroceibacterium spongiae TaxID=2320269 RepID=A0A420EC66_9SPHN|nr:hypothetical protein D6851_15270 [Altericroceibacterium spongiae]
MPSVSSHTNAPAAAEDFARNWEAVRHDGAIQFAPVELPEKPQTPDWLARLFKAVGDLLRPVAEALGVSWPTLKWILLALAIALLLFIVWRLLGPLLLPSSKKEDTPEEWAPDQAQAVALLEDADRLVAEGRFGEATHLLLQRSVGHIRDTRPDLLDPSSTAREISRLDALSDTARQTFALIAERVEHSLFALRPLNDEDWQVARKAYSEFALTRPTAAEGPLGA